MFLITSALITLSGSAVVPAVEIAEPNPKVMSQA